MDFWPGRGAEVSMAAWGGEGRFGEERRSMGFRRCLKIKFVRVGLGTNKKGSHCCEPFCGLDGTRTRDLRRDRAAF